MAQITAASVKELRDRTLAGMADCKKALEETSGDMEKAADWLRKKGITKAGQNQSRVATEGSVSSYIHMGGKIGVLGSIPIAFSDYEIPDPSNGFATVKDNGLLEFVLVFEQA